MGFKNGVISLNSPNSAYYPGQIISGNITFSLEMPTNFTVITVTYNGKGKVNFLSDRGRCTGQEQYFNVTLPVCGGKGVFTLPAGQHQYPFQYQIPFQVPGTFKGNKGSIEYYVEAVAESPFKHKESVTKPFTVVVPVDLNNIEECKHPIQMAFEKSSGFCCFGGGAAAVQFRVPVAGFCPGQTIPIHVSVDNDSSNVEIRRLLFELTRVTAYRSQSPSSELITPPEVIESVKRGPLLCKTKGEFIVNFAVPALIAPDLDVCELFGIEYSLRVTMKMTGCSDDESDEATIYLGHVPLNGTGDFVHPLKEHLPSGPIPVKPSAPPLDEQKQNTSPPDSGPQVEYSATTADGNVEDVFAEAKALCNSVFNIFKPGFSSPLKSETFEIKTSPFSETRISTSVVNYTFRMGGNNEKTRVYTQNRSSDDYGSDDNGTDAPYYDYVVDDNNYEDDNDNNADSYADDTAGDGDTATFGGDDSD